MVKQKTKNKNNNMGFMNDWSAYKNLIDKQKQVKKK